MFDRWRPGALLARWGRVGSAHHQILRGMVWVALFVFLGKLAGAAKEIVIAWRYGISEEVDAYLFVFNLVSWPVSVWFSVLTVVLVPLATRIRQKIPTELSCFRAELLGLTLLLGVALGLLTWLGLPILLRSSWAGLPLTTANIAVGMVPTLFLLLPLGVVISLFSAWMLAAGRHANTLMESAPALAIFLTLLAMPGGGIAPLVWGTLAGFALHLACLAVALVRKGEFSAPQFAASSPWWGAFWQSFGVMLAGQVLISLTSIVDQFFAAQLGTGAIATLSYANRILALVLGLGATAVSRATLPVFSQAHASGQGHLSRMAAQWGGLLFVLGLFAVLGGWWLAAEGVKLLFERGAFTREATGAVAEVLRFGLLQLPFYFAAIVFVSLLASQGRHGVIAVVAGSSLLVKIAALMMLTPSLGIRGVALSTSVMYATILLSLTVMARAVKK